MSDKMRSEFEAWLKREWPKALTIKYNSGDYRSDYVQQSWIAWQASREAIEIELSPYISYDRELCVQGIEAAGLKVKPC